MTEAKQDCTEDKKEHILVCLSPSPSNQAVILAAKELARASNGQFTALFVETPTYERLSQENKIRLSANIHFARKHGAAVTTVCGDDVAFQIAEFANESNVTKIVMGSSHTSRQFGISRSTADRLLDYAPVADVFLIPDGNTSPFHMGKAEPGVPRSQRLAGLVKTVLILLAATGAGAFFQHIGLTEISTFTVFFVGIIITSILTASRFYSIVSAALSVLIFNFLFAEPHFSFFSNDIGYPAAYILLILAALIVGHISERINLQSRQAAQTAYRTKIMLETNQYLQQTDNAQDIIAVISNQLNKLLTTSIFFFEPDGKKLKAPQVFKADETDVSFVTQSQIERQAALWTYQNNRHSGVTTGTYRGARCIYMPVHTADQSYGVVGIDLHNRTLSIYENNLVLSILGECALAFERELSNRKRAEAEAEANNTKLRANLLRSISHDLRTPLTSISGNAAILTENYDDISKETRIKLSGSIYDEALWLIRSVENLLSLTRLDDMGKTIELHPELLEDIISDAVSRISGRLEGRKIKVELPDEILLVQADGRLIVQVLINLFDNALHHMGQDGEITVSAKKLGSNVVIDVADNGSGVPEEIKPYIFDMFFTASGVKPDSRRGFGLGLALCKSIITAHNGSISVRDNNPHGAVFAFTLKEAAVNGQ